MEIAMRHFALATLLIVLEVTLPAGTAIAQTSGAPAAGAPPDGGVPTALNSINSTLNALIATVNAQSKQIAQLTNVTPPPAPTVLLAGPVNALSAQNLACYVAKWRDDRRNSDCHADWRERTPNGKSAVHPLRRYIFA